MIYPKGTLILWGGKEGPREGREAQRWRPAPYGPPRGAQVRRGQASAERGLRQALSPQEPKGSG